MSEPHDRSPEEQVRRLLADARHTAPMPDDVAARLDAVLADLRGEDPATPAPRVATQPPIDLAAARRRRNVRTWLVAAAAVILIGVGIDQVAHLSLSGGSADDSGGSASTAMDDRAGGGADAHRPEGAASGNAPEPAEVPALAPILLHPDRFGTQVTRIQRRAAHAPRAQGSSASTTDGALLYGLDSLADAYRSTCRIPDSGRGHAVPVRYGGQPGVLVFRPVRGDTQVVDLFLCGSDHPERSITLAAP